MPGVSLAALGQQPSKRLPRHRGREAFLKGPIPWAWLVEAAGLPGRALQVALLLWKEAGCRKSRMVSFCLSHGAELGLKPDPARRALRRLQMAGLVNVRHSPGRGLEVTLQDVPGKTSAC